MSLASAVYHVGVTLLLAALLALSLISLGSFALKHNEIGDKYKCPQGIDACGHCILFVKFKNSSLVLNKSLACLGAIWGEGFVVLTAAALALLTLAKCAFGVRG